VRGAFGARGGLAVGYLDLLVAAVGNLDEQAGERRRVNPETKPDLPGSVRRGELGLNPVVGRRCIGAAAEQAGVDVASVWMTPLEEMSQSPVSSCQALPLESVPTVSEFARLKSSVTRTATTHPPPR
jgi:hypothetical protein